MKDEARRRVSKTIQHALRLGLVAGFGGYVLLAIIQGPVRAQAPQAPQAPAVAAPQATPPVPGAPPPPGPPGGRGFIQEERKIVGQFDRNGDKRLDSVERRAARDWLASPEGRAGGRGITLPRGRGIVAGTPGPRMVPSDLKSYPRTPLYDIGTLRTVFLQFENNEWEQELAAFNNTDVEVPAVATVDGKTYKDVGVHFRGASSFMMVPEGSKRSLNLAFDFVNDGQDLYGYRTLNLLNVNNDPTFVRTVLYSEIARQYLPAPKTNYMRVVINGEYWGVYLNAEQFSKEFINEHFGTTKGARWKVPGSPMGRGGMEYLGDDPMPYRRIYEMKSKDDPKAWTDLIALFRTLNQTPLDKLEAALSRIFNVDGVLRFLALEMVLVNSDGYWTRASDYDIYQDEKRKFHVIPHDMNEGLADGNPIGPPPPPPPGASPPGAQSAQGAPGAQGAVVQGPPGGRGAPPPGGRGAPPTATLDPLIGLHDATKPLRSKLLAVPELRERYMSYVREIATKWLDWKVLAPRVQKYQALIAADVKTDTRKLYTDEAFVENVETGERSLRSFVDRRRAFLLK
jgi:hypothetical protein